MKDDNLYWLGFFGIITFGLIALVSITLGYADKKNKLILAATTCEQAVLIDGDSVDRRLLICLQKNKK